MVQFKRTFRIHTTGPLFLISNFLLTSSNCCHTWQVEEKSIVIHLAVCLAYKITVIDIGDLVYL